MDEILSQIANYVDFQYIMGIILLSRFLFNYSPLKSVKYVTDHKQYCVYILGSVVAAGFMFYYYCCVPDAKLIPYAWKLLLSYTVATSIYELAGQRIFEFIETKLKGDNNAAPPAPVQ